MKCDNLIGKSVDYMTSQYTLQLIHTSCYLSKSYRLTLIPLIFIAINISVLHLLYVKSTRSYLKTKIILLMFPLFWSWNLSQI